MSAWRGWATLVVLSACSSEDATTPGPATDASTDGATDSGSGDSGPIQPASDGGCDASVPGMSAGSESKCAGKPGQPVPGSGDAGEKAPGQACASGEECQPICCTCKDSDGGEYVSSVSVCGCGNLCASAAETCAFYEKTFALCK